MKRRMLWIIPLLLALLLPLVALVLIVDDWNRDLTTNTAATTADAADPLLRPLVVSGSVEQVAAQVRAAAQTLPQWQYVAEQSEGESTVLSFTRRTQVFGFVDDISVTLAPQNGSVQLTARSQSRVGRGDLGQNPRNLKQLLAELRRQEEATSQ